MGIGFLLGSGFWVPDPVILFLDLGGGGGDGDSRAENFFGGVVIFV